MGAVPFGQWLCFFQTLDLETCLVDLVFLLLRQSPLWRVFKQRFKLLADVVFYTHISSVTD